MNDHADRQRIDELEAEVAELRAFKARVLAAVGPPAPMVDALELEQARAAAIAHGYYADVIAEAEAKIGAGPACLAFLRRLAAGPFVDQRYRNAHPDVDDPDELLRP